MTYYLILARSVTFAQRMQRALDRVGIGSRIFRAPRELTDLGCAYALKIAVKDLREALTVLHREKLDPIQIFLFQRGFYQEVGRDASGRPETGGPYRETNRRPEAERPYREADRRPEAEKPYREANRREVGP